MDDKERRYYLNKLHDYANFHGAIRGYLMCFNEGAYNAVEVLKKMDECEKENTKKMEKLEVKYAEEG